MEDRYDLARFVTAQDAGGAYVHAVEELGRGLKASHWMWFVFPQLTGLGHSPMSRTYAITGLDEAREYLRHAVLGERLRSCAAVVEATVDRTAVQIFGAVDAVKLRSCMTLFARAAPEETVFVEVLDRFFDGAVDARTTELL